jgi:hypothetical protein
LLQKAWFYFDHNGLIQMHSPHSSTRAKSW